MKFKTPSKPVVKVAYYADNKHQVKSQDTSKCFLDFSKAGVSIIEKLCIQLDENQAYMYSCVYGDNAYSKQSNVIGIRQICNARPKSPLEKLRKFYSPITNQTN